MSVFYPHTWHLIKNQKDWDKLKEDLHTYNKHDKYILPCSFDDKSCKIESFPFIATLRIEWSDNRHKYIYVIVTCNQYEVREFSDFIRRIDIREKIMGIYE